MRVFFKNIADEKLADFMRAFSGYDASEIEKIERLYDIKVEGQLKYFLMEIGRCDGGLIGDSMIQLYRPTWRVREHLLFQVNFFTQMQEERYYDYMKRPFVFSFLGETQYYYLRTDSFDRDVVWHFDSNTLVVERTGWDLAGFIEYLALNGDAVPDVFAQGDILKI
ncbi:SMI1/KNR4 family protein [Pseudomonas fuscovaginae UPB0736]|nr:SMI1/KNR4 family protein [Pseudomonas fuscovaginae]UUQ63287.1 SMI1/KNR4 family protein [Pseudomonas fuscovaginae UPB0736]